MQHRNLISVVIGAGITILLTRPAHAWDKMEGVGKASHKGVVTAAAEWVKDKDDKFDVSMKVTNESDKTILLFAGDMKCACGAQTGGTIDIHQDRRTIDLRGKESRTLIMTCRLGNKEKGNFSITMKVFSNPTSDSNTPGPVLVESLVWKQGQAEGKVL